MRSIYDAIFVAPALTSSVAIASQTSGTNSSTGQDTKGYNSAMIHGEAEIASGSPTTSTINFALYECATSGGSYTAANDNTGTAIASGATSVKTARLSYIARIEGLNLNRKRYLQVQSTVAFSGGTSPAILSYAELLLGHAYELPVNTTASNT